MFNVKHSISLLVAGSIALDTLEGDFGTAPDELGGSALYFALAASLLTPVALVAAVGRQDEPAVRGAIAGRAIDAAGLDVLDAPTFRWHARHVGHGNVDLGHDDRIYDVWRPRVPSGFTGWAFAGSMRPALQLDFLRQAADAQLRASDAMLSYVHSAAAETTEVIAGSHWFFANTDELHAIDARSTVSDFRVQRDLQGLCLKAGPRGAGVYTEGEEIHVPALTARRVVDTTGAGDALAAGFLARRLTAPEAGLRDALEHGVALASIAIDDIGLRALRRATPQLLAERLSEVRSST
jgi:sugar/nucleoside kinase (ribokinase family)